MAKKRMMTRAGTKEKKNERDSAQRFYSKGIIRAIEGDESERVFELSFSSEEPYERFWGTEILSHAEGAVDLERLNQIGCVLYNHDRDKVIGKVLSADVENGRGTARIQFDEDAESEVIYKKVKNGTLKGVSVGYMVDVWEDVASNKSSSDGRFTGPCSIATKWTPFEISIVSVPADSTVGVGRSGETDGEKTRTEVSGNYYYEKQLQINKNSINRRVRKE